MIELGAIQDLAKQMDAVEAENAELRDKLAASERRFAELEAADKVRRPPNSSNSAFRGRLWN